MKVLAYLMITCTVHGKILTGKNWQIWQIVSYPQKFPSSTFTDTGTIKMRLAYVLTVAYSPNF